MARTTRQVLDRLSDEYRALTELIQTTRHDLFRIETLPSYDTAITTSDLRRWLVGEREGARSAS